MIPTDEQIQQTLAMIDERLDDPMIDLVKNESVKYGYIKAKELIERRETNYNIGKFKLPRGKLVSVQMKAIAVLAVDYMKGEVKQRTLVSVPLK